MNISTDRHRAKYQGSADVSVGDTRVRRAMLVHVLKALIAARSHEGVLVIHLEDLHWADSGSLEVLTGILGDVETRRVMVLTTCRPGFTFAWDGAPYVDRLVLHDLPQDAALDLAHAVFGAS